MLTPNRITCARLLPSAPDVSSRVNANGGAVTATSSHTGGVNVLLGDGSVSVLADAIDQTAWRNLASRAGGEL